MESTLDEARFPQEVALGDGSSAQIRLMTPADGAAVLAFANNLPQEDLLFLRRDITDAAVVDDWMESLATQSTYSLVAYEGETLAGYASVNRNPAPWTRRVGEIRVNVGPDYRGKGLGRNLTSEIFDLARSLGLKKVMAHMTTDQAGAQAAFRRLGFVPEALLADYVEDRNGMSRDLVIMSYDVDGLSDQMAEPLRI